MVCNSFWMHSDWSCSKAEACPSLSADMERAVAIAAAAPSAKDWRVVSDSSTTPRRWYSNNLAQAARYLKADLAHNVLISSYKILEDGVLVRAAPGRSFGIVMLRGTLNSLIWSDVLDAEEDVTDVTDVEEEEEEDEDEDEEAEEEEEDEDGEEEEEE